MWIDTEIWFWLDVDWHNSSLRFCFPWVLPPFFLVMAKEEPLGSSMGNRNWYNKGNSDLLPPLHCWTLDKQLQSNPSKRGSFFWEKALGWMLPKTFYIELGEGAVTDSVLSSSFAQGSFVSSPVPHLEYYEYPHPLSTFKGQAKGWLLVQGSSAFQQSQGRNDSSGSCRWCLSPYWCHLRKKQQLHLSTACFCRIRRRGRFFKPTLKVTELKRSHWLTAVDHLECIRWQDSQRPHSLWSSRF